MITRILDIDDNSLSLCGKIISDGGAVAFPTETVYGLGANAFDNSAVENIFKIKGRPNDNPLIVHVHTGYDINKLVSYVPQYANRLAAEFLPGPLTMVYKSRGNVSTAVSCGLDTLAIRVPSHEGAQQFLRFLDLPVAAPSANISKHVSPVTAEHVFNDLNGKIEVILNGGKCTGGIESTVLDCTGEYPVILRSGLITREMIEKSVGKCGEYVLKEGEQVRSPGMKYKHYAPNCKTVMYEKDNLAAAVSCYKSNIAQGVKAFILCDGSTAALLPPEVKNVLNLGDSEREMAFNLYDKLREGEGKADLIIAVTPSKNDGIMKGVLNRLTKACNSL